MAKKHINSSSLKVIGEGVKYKKKPTPWVEGPVSRRVRLERERYFWKNNIRDRKDIEEYVEFMKKEWFLQDKEK